VDTTPTEIPLGGLGRIHVTNSDAEKSFEGRIEVGNKYYEIIKELPGT
jgi:hypothetical protein